VQARAEAERLKRSSEGQEVPSLELAALQAKCGALAAKHEEALGKLAQMAAAKEAATSEAHTHQQHARGHAIRCGYFAYSLQWARKDPFDPLQYHMKLWRLPGKLPSGR